MTTTTFCNFFSVYSDTFSSWRNLSWNLHPCVLCGIECSFYPWNFAITHLEIALTCSGVTPPSVVPQKGDTEGNITEILHIWKYVYLPLYQIDELAGLWISYFLFSLKNFATFFHLLFGTIASFVTWLNSDSQVNIYVFFFLCGRFEHLLLSLHCWLNFFMVGSEIGFFVCLFVCASYSGNPYSLSLNTWFS